MSENLSADEQFIEQIKAVVNKNIDNENFSVKVLAEEVGISRSMLHRKLIKLTGRSASDLITNIRLEKAMELLKKDVATVAEIAYNVGFRNPSYFNRVFKKYYNVSPGEVKKNHQTNNIDGHSELILFAGKRRSVVMSAGILLLVVLAVVLFQKPFSTKEKSVAVLPLANLTGQEENEYFVAGLHDALIGELGDISALRVISRTSTLRYRESDLLLEDIARDLKVNFIVEASLVNIADSVKLIVQVIDVFPKENHLFVGEYSNNMSNILKLQSSVIKDIADNIRVKLTSDEVLGLEKKREVNPEVYKSCLRGMYYINLGTKENFKKGIKHLLDAIDSDPADPFAYASLSLGYAKVGHGQVDSEESFKRAVSAAQTAIKLDPTVDEAYTALAMLHLYNSWNWEEARIAFENAIAQNPNNETAHAHFAWYWVLFNDLDKAVYHAKKAVELNPLYVSLSSWLSLIYFNNGQLAEAETSALRALELKENVPYADLVLCLLRTREGNYDEAINFLQKLPKTSFFNMWRTYVYVASENREAAMKIWENLNEKGKNGKVNEFHRGMMASNLGFTDLAFQYLSKAVERKDYPVQYLNFNYSSKPLKNDPRFNELLHRMNLPRNRVLLASQ